MLYMINAYYDTDNVLNYNIINSGTKEIIRFTDPEMQQFLRRASVENLALSGGHIKSTRGDLRRYMRIPASAVVLARLEDDQGNPMGFRVVDIDGYVKDLSTQEALNRGFSCGYANAKIVTNKKGSFISCIGGSFPAEVVRTEQYEGLKRLVIEIMRKKQTYGVVTIELEDGTFNREKIVLPIEQSTEGYIMGRIFNRFLRGFLYESIDGRRPTRGKQPKGIYIEKTAGYNEGLPILEYQKACEFLGIHFEKIVEKPSSTIYQIRS